MMPTSIVNNDDHQMAFVPVVPKKFCKEHEKRGSIEFLAIQLCDQASVVVSDGTKNTDALSGRCMKHHGINILWWYPHGAA